MSSVTADTVATAEPKRKSGLVSMFEHTKYVLGENKVTAFAFGLLVVILFAAIFGPYVVPYDPLASDTANRMTTSATVPAREVSSGSSSSVAVGTAAPTA